VAIAFFDLDQTLLATNSAALWVKREVELGHISYAQAARAVIWLARYQLGFVEMESAVARAISMLAGTRALDLRARTRSFYDAVVRNLYRPGGLAALHAHRERGDKLVLLTSSTQYLSDLVQEELRLDAVLCNRFEVDSEGLHTGKPLGGVCFGAGKLAFAADYARGVGEQLGDASFYTDSYSDRLVLEHVGRPTAVNPDIRLRRLALKKRWPVADWGRPA
jgi:HAD superfamily hydrolase (TIGR01490 family)